MKGIAINFTVSTIITLLVVIVAILIIVGARLDLIFAGESLKGLFEPNKFTLCVTDNEGKCAKPPAKADAKNIALTCVDPVAGAYTINVEDVRFYYCVPPGDNAPGGKSFDFLLALDYREKMYLGKSNENPIFTCTTTDEPVESCASAYVCDRFDSRSPLSFSVHVPRIDDKIILHITAWSYAPTLINKIEQGTTLAGLLNDAYPNYITSADVPVRSFTIDPSKCGITSLVAYNEPIIPKTQDTAKVIAVVTGPTDKWSKITISVRDITEGGYMNEEISCTTSPCTWSKTGLRIGSYRYEAKLFGTDGKETAATRGEFTVEQYVPPLG